MHNNNLMNIVKEKKIVLSYLSQQNERDCTSGKCSIGCFCFSGVGASRNHTRESCAS